LAVTALFICGCGNTTRYANKPRPATPINLTVYIGNNHVSVSPASIGAGPVVFEVTNQSGSAQSLSVSSAGGNSLASTGPINPQGTAQVAVDLARGEYQISASSGGSSDASQAQPGSLSPGRVHVGAPRPSAGGTLLSP
jgi:hypothetical protein